MIINVLYFLSSKQFLKKLSYSIGVSANIRVGQLIGSNEPLKAKNATRVAFTINCNYIRLIVFIYSSNF